MKMNRRNETANKEQQELEVDERKTKEKHQKLVMDFVNEMPDELIRMINMKIENCLSERERILACARSNIVMNKIVELVDSVIMESKKDDEHERRVESSTSYRARFVRNVTMDDTTGEICLEQGSRRLKLWELQNTGSRPWSKKCRFIQVTGRRCASKQDGKPHHHHHHFPCPEVKPDEKGVLAIAIHVPKKCGKHCTSWMMVDEEGKNMLDEDIQWSFIVVRRNKPEEKQEQHMVPSFQTLLLSVDHDKRHQHGKNSSNGQREENSQKPLPPFDIIGSDHDSETMKLKQSLVGEDTIDINIFRAYLAQTDACTS